MTAAFFLVISCSAPVTIATMRFKDWKACRAEQHLFQMKDDPKGECLAQCVGGAIYKQMWNGVIKKQ